jgi:hypothetical protein
MLVIMRAKQDAPSVPRNDVKETSSLRPSALTVKYESVYARLETAFESGERMGTEVENAIAVALANRSREQVAEKTCAVMRMCVLGRTPCTQETKREPEWSQLECFLALSVPDTAQMPFCCPVRPAYETGAAGVLQQAQQSCTPDKANAEVSLLCRSLQVY